MPPAQICCARAIWICNSGNPGRQPRPLRRSHPWAAGSSTGPSVERGPARATQQRPSPSRILARNPLPAGARAARCGVFRWCDKLTDRFAVKVNKSFPLPVEVNLRLPMARLPNRGLPWRGWQGTAMVKNWRISTFNGALLAAYFMTAWTISAFRIMISPVHGFYERQNVSVALFINDHLHLAGLSTVRAAWLLALGKLTVVAFFGGVRGAHHPRHRSARPAVATKRSASRWRSAALISFASMLMASIGRGSRGAAPARHRIAADARHRGADGAGAAGAAW